MPLVNKFYKQFSVRGRANKQDQCWVTKSNKIIAACRLQNKDDVLFLSTVFVDPEFRTQGVARYLLKSALDAQYSNIYTFAYRDLEPFYLGLGFERVSALPEHLSCCFANYVRQKRDIVAMCIYK
uniref:Acetyltransferase, GNAT family protein n=1 Tax=Pseudoalteromonas citrea DSM 8771 TaxID=1117314 RepID=U1KMG5_9GAMM